MEENLSLFIESWEYRGQSSVILAQSCHPENSSVMLSKAKHLSRWAEMLRFAQHDK